MLTAIPVDGITVTFTAVSGPNAGKVVQAVTDADGNATIDYTSAVAGADVWQASFVDPDEHTADVEPGHGHVDRGRRRCRWS